MCFIKNLYAKVVYSRDWLSQLSQIYSYRLENDAESSILSINELPNALENLSNALQTVQDLFKLNNANNNKTNSSTITDQLNSLSSTILSSVAKSNILSSNTTTTTTSSANSNLDSNTRTSSSRKQKVSTLSVNAPVYNPTPILELKKFSQQSSQEELVTGIKRKSDLQSDDDQHENLFESKSHEASELTTITNIVAKEGEASKKKKVTGETSETTQEAVAMSSSSQALVMQKIKRIN